MIWQWLASSYVREAIVLVGLFWGVCSFSSRVLLHWSHTMLQHLKYGSMMVLYNVCSKSWEIKANVRLSTPIFRIIIENIYSVCSSHFNLSSTINPRYLTCLTLLIYEPSFDIRYGVLSGRLSRLFNLCDVPVIMNSVFKLFNASLLLFNLSHIFPNAGISSSFKLLTLLTLRPSIYSRI